LIKGEQEETGSGKVEEETDTSEEKKAAGQGVTGAERLVGTSKLRERYGGEWAIFIDTGDQTSKRLAIELAKEGFNLAFVVRKEGA
jgi:hypothetical protein